MVKSRRLGINNYYRGRNRVSLHSFTGARKFKKSSVFKFNFFSVINLKIKQQMAINLWPTKLSSILFHSKPLFSLQPLIKWFFIRKMGKSQTDRYYSSFVCCSNGILESSVLWANTHMDECKCEKSKSLKWGMIRKPIRWNFYVIFTS